MNLGPLQRLLLAFFSFFHKWMVYSDKYGFYRSRVDEEGRRIYSDKQADEKARWHIR